jgi:hypothetical protein
MGLLIQPDARLADGQLGNEVRYFDGEEVRKFLFHCMKSGLGPMVGTDIIMDRLKGVLVKAGCFMCNTTDDHRANGGATAATDAMSTMAGNECWSRK